MRFFDGTWARREFIRYCDGLSTRDWESMPIEERNDLVDTYDAYIEQLSEVYYS